MFRLVEEYEEDPEEERLRTNKYADERAKKELEIRQQQREQERAAAATRAEQELAIAAVQETEWLQALQREADTRAKLGSGTPRMQFRISGDSTAASSSSASSGTNTFAGRRANGCKTPQPGHMRGGRSRSSPGGQTGKQMVPHILPLEGQQPPMADVIRLAPGVAMNEGGKKLGSVQAPCTGAQMSRKDYAQWTLSQHRQGVPSEAPASDSGDIGSLVPMPGLVAAVSASSSSSHSVSHPSSGSGCPAGQQARCSGDAAMQPRAPALVNRWQQQAYSLGLRPAARDRVPTSGTQPFRSNRLRPIRAQPALGATMGHGLGNPASSSCHDIGYACDLQDEASDVDGLQPSASVGSLRNASVSVPERGASERKGSSSAASRDRCAGGRIHANRDLLQQLFREVTA